MLSELLHPLAADGDDSSLRRLLLSKLGESCHDCVVVGIRPLSPHGEEHSPEEAAIAEAVALAHDRLREELAQLRVILEEREDVEWRELVDLSAHFALILELIEGEVRLPVLDDRLHEVEWAVLELREEDVDCE